MPTKVYHCGDCRGYRLMMVVVTTHPGKPSRVTREVVCPACEWRAPLGLCCPKCGDARLHVQNTRQRTGGVTARLRVCRHCRHRVHTRERVAGAAHA